MRRSRAVALQLFRTKSPDHLIAEAAAPDRQMKRTLDRSLSRASASAPSLAREFSRLPEPQSAGQTFPTGLETPVINFIQAWFSGTGAVLGRAGAGPAIADFVYRGRHGLRVCCALLCRTCVHDPGLRIGVHLFLRYDGRDRRVDHRLGFDPGICGRQHGGRGRLVRLFRPSSAAAFST